MNEKFATLYPEIARIGGCSQAFRKELLNRILDLEVVNAFQIEEYGTERACVV